MIHQITSFWEQAWRNMRENENVWLKALHGQSDICIGSAEFTVIWPPQKSGHSYFLRYTEQSCCEGRECVYTGPPAPT